MLWAKRLAVIRGQLKKLLEEAANDDQKAAARSMMTSVTAWGHVDENAARLGRRPTKINGACGAPGMGPQRI